ncbi:MAG: Polyketide cyclase / dehydrase and lipid transport [Pseudomonadota bacterium]|jgi:hypothetical protein
MVTYLDERHHKGLVRIWFDETREVDTSASELFALLGDLDAWPSWTPGLKAIKRKPGPIVPGTHFTMVLAPAIALPCKLYVSEPGRVEWGGDFLGSVIRHRFELTALSPTRTRLRHVEYATNLLAFFTLAVERVIHAHDLRWTRAIEKRFAGK